MDCSQIKDVFEKETDEMGTSKSENTKIWDWEKHILEHESQFDDFDLCQLNITGIPSLCVVGEASAEGASSLTYKPSSVLLEEYGHRQIVSYKSPSFLNDQDDSVIWQNPLYFTKLVYFKENDHFKFVGDDLLAKGCHGDVHYIELTPDCTKHSQSYIEPLLVLKKTNVKPVEIDIIEKTTNHPNFVTTYLIVHKPEGNPYRHEIVMENCGPSMKDYLLDLQKRSEAMETHFALFCWMQVVEATAKLHDMNFIHRDIKPSNILFSDDDKIRVKLADLGLAENLDHVYARNDHSSSGTSNFTAPEILEKKAYGRPVDIYSLAKTLLEMLALDVYKLKDRDKDLGELIERCLDNNPDNRLTAEDILRIR